MFVREVEFAKILPNGELDQWKYTNALKQGRFYLSTTTTNGHLYALGGALVSPQSTENSVFSESDSLSPWNVQRTSLLIASSFAKNIYFYILAGFAAFAIGRICASSR